MDLKIWINITWTYISLLTLFGLTSLDKHYILRLTSLDRHYFNLHFWINITWTPTFLITGKGPLLTIIVLHHLW